MTRDVVERIFLDAAELPADDREAFVAGATADDEIRAEVLSLLASLDADDLLPALEDERPFGGRFPERVGPYRIVRPLGEGGMGVVLLAIREGDGFEQTVALKLLKGRWIDPSLIRRIEEERRLLARLEHPGIARLIDGGLTDDGHPYYAMEYVDGTDVIAWCDDRRMGIPERVALFAEVCDALQHAHQQLVVHRDLKPSNIMVDASGRPRLLDFGIAKAVEDLESGDATAAWATPAYASPEQLLGGAVSTRSDVYSLGVLLSELLSGSRPWDTADLTPAEVGRRLGTSPPRRPSEVAREPSTTSKPTVLATTTVADARATTLPRLARTLKGDLDTIVLKAVALEPERRYASAAALADDLRRWLDGRPIEARADGPLYLMTRFARRHRAVAASLAALVVVLVTGTVAVGWQARRADSARAAAEHEAERSRLVTSIMTDLFRLGDPGRTLGDTIGVRQVLDAGAARVEASLGGEPSLQASLYLELARVYRNLGILDRAEDLGGRALDLRRDLQSGSAEFAETAGFLGLVLRDEERHEEAEVRFREALETRKALGLPADSAAGYLTAQLGWTVRDLGRHAEAERLMGEALEIQRAVLGPGHPLVASTLFGQSAALHDLGSFDRSEELLAEAIDERITEVADPSTARLMRDLGMIRRLREEYATALRVLEGSFDAHVALYGREHPETLQAAEELALEYAALGRFEPADRLLRDNLDISIRTLGEEHGHTRGAREGVASVALDLGRWDEAVARYDTAVVAKRIALGGDHPGVVFTLVRYGDALLAAGRFADARAVYRESLDMGERLGGSPGVYAALARHGLARTALGEGRPAEAESELAQADAIFAETLRADHRYRLEVDRTRARLLLERGDAEAAIALLERVLADEALRRPSPSPRRAETHLLLVRAHRATGDDARAAEHRRLGLEEGAALPASHPLIRELRGG